MPPKMNLQLPMAMMEEAAQYPGCGIGHSDDNDRRTIALVLGENAAADSGSGDNTMAHNASDTFHTMHPPSSPTTEANEQRGRLDGLAGDERVRELATALIREHAAHYSRDHPSLRNAVEMEYPRTPESVTKRSIVTSTLGFEPVSNKRLSLLEEAVIHLLVQKDPHLINKEPSLSFDFNETGNGVDINGLSVGQATNSGGRFLLNSLDELNLEQATILGKGAGGRVMKASLRARPDECFAVKEILVGSNEVINQVKAEMSVLWGTASSHDDVPSPFLVQCHGVFYDQGTLYIVMDLMNGALKDALDRARAPFPEPHLRAIFFQVLHGLYAMHHTKKQLHRDIKPHNILYNDQGSVRLSDFGIASDRVSTLHQNARATFCGTLVYMSPARVEGANYSFEADIWGIGVSLYQLATMQTIPGSNTPYGIIGFRQERPQLPEVSPTGQPFSDEFRDFVYTCLDPNATNETLSAKHLLNHPWMKTMRLEQSQHLVQEFAQMVEISARQQQAQRQQQGGGRTDFSKLDAVL